MTGDDSLTGHAGVPITEKEEAQKVSSLPPSGIEIDFPKASGERLRSAVAAVNVAGHRTSLGKGERGRDAKDIGNGTARILVVEQVAHCNRDGR